MGKLSFRNQSVLPVILHNRRKNSCSSCALCAFYCYSYIYFFFKGVGTVVSGTCYKGRIQLNDSLLLGPDLIGQFRSCVIKGIHRKRMPVKECRGGQTASFSLKKVKRSELRKGMVIVSEKVNPAPSWEFEAEILILHHPTTISINYQAMGIF